MYLDYRDRKAGHSSPPVDKGELALYYTPTIQS